MSNNTQNILETLKSASDFFNEQWQLYQQVFTDNALKHQEIYNTLDQFLSENWQQPFSVLEIGCGDATVTSKALSTSQVSFYKGLDISKPALEIAAYNMGKVAAKKEFIEGDLLDIIPVLATTETASFDLVISSFVLHHLSLEQKDEITGKIRRLLKPNGVFLWIDVIRLETETREEYMKRHLAILQNRLSSITEKQFEQVKNHITTSDYPEKATTCHSLAQKNGFTRGLDLYRDEEDTVQFFAFVS